MSRSRCRDGRVALGMRRSRGGNSYGCVFEIAAVETARATVSELFRTIGWIESSRGCKDLKLSGLEPTSKATDNDSTGGSWMDPTNSD